MIIEKVTLNQLILAIGFIIGGFALGVIVERVILARLKRFAKRTSWEGDEVIIGSLKGVAVVWLALAGIHAAFAILPMKPLVGNIMGKVVLVVGLFTATIVLSKVVVGFLGLHGRRTARATPLASVYTNIVGVVIFVIGLVFILQSLGVSITALLTAMGVGGLAVALALQPTLSHLFAGIQIIMSKQLEPGDWVELDTGAKGFVVDISWRNTIIQELPNNLIIIPNAKLADSIITNFSRPQKKMSVMIDVGVSYDSDLSKVEEITKDVARQVVTDVQGGVSDFEPLVRFHTFGDFSIQFSVIMRVNEFVNKYLVCHEFIKALHKRYKEEGIVIPFPIRTVHMKPPDID